MYNNKKILAVIPARSGSKGLIDKNIKELCGKPMLAYSIDAAKHTKIIDEIFVSTDALKYKKIAEEYGANVPFLRSEKLASDIASTWDAVKEAIEQYQKIGQTFDICILLQPTSPLRSAEDILETLKMMIDKDANTVVSVCETDHSPLWENILPKNNSMEHFFSSEISQKRRQDLPTYYRLNGAIYTVKVDFLMQHTDIYEEKSYATIMPKDRSIDVDDHYDFMYADILMNAKVDKDEV